MTKPLSEFFFYIPYNVPSQNVTNAQHWSKRHKNRKLAANLIAHYARGAFPATQFRKLHIHAYRKQRCHDIANLIGGAKSLIDAIKLNKLIVDDSDKWVEISYSQAALSQLPVDVELRFGVQPVTKISLSWIV